MNDLEDMKALWLDLNKRVSSLEEENRRLVRQVVNNKYKTAQERLIRKYSVFIIIEIIMILYIILVVEFNPMVVEKYKTVTLLSWSLFLAGAAGLDLYLRESMKRMDVYNLNVSEITRLAARNWKLHKMGIIIGLPIAFGAIILFGLLMDANKFTIYGMIVGGIIGFIIGLSQLRKFSESYHLLQTKNQD